jgi:hypothetical protein
MRTFKPLVLLTLLVAQPASTQAADLNGAWTIDASACGKVFTKENNQLAFKQDADLYAGGLIVRGKQITGTFQECTVKSLHDDGPTCVYPLHRNSRCRFDWVSSSGADDFRVK